MKKIIVFAFVIFTLLLCCVSCDHSGSLDVELDTDGKLLTTDMTTEDLREFLKVTYYKDSDIYRMKGKEIADYDIRCSFDEGETEIFVDYQGMSYSQRGFFFDKSKITYEGDFTFYNYKEKDYLIQYNGSDSVISFPERTPYAIFNDVFAKNKSLETIYLGDSVTAIGNRAFRACLSLKEIHFGSAIKKVCRDSFEGCVNIEMVNAPSLEDWCEIEFGADNILYEWQVIIDNHYIVYAAEVEFVNGGVLEESNGEVYIVDKAGNKTFYCYSTVINPLEMSGSLCVDGEHITEVVIPESVTELNNYAFTGSDITSVKLHEGITSIGYNSFNGCEQLESFSISTVNETIVNQINHNAISTDLASTFNEKCLNEYEGAMYLGNENNPYLILVSIGEGEGEVLIHENTKAIANNAFLTDKKMNTVIIPDGVEYIGAHAFSYLPQSIEIVIGTGVKYIGYYALHDYMGKVAKNNVTFLNSEGWYFTGYGGGGEFDPSSDYDPTYIFTKELYRDTNGE